MKKTFIRSGISILFLTLIFTFTQIAKADVLSVKYGDTNPNVTAIQNILIAQGFLKTQATGYFGSGTRSAIMAFQKANGLSPVGSIGPKTSALLSQIAGTNNTQIPVVSKIATPISSSGDKVVLLGGMNRSGDIFYNDVWSSSNQLTLWNKILSNTKTPGPSQYGQESRKFGAYLNGKIYVAGFSDETKYFPGNNMMQVWSSSDSGANWIKLTTSTQVPFYINGLLSFNNKLWLISDSVWSSPDGTNWTKVSDVVPFSKLIGYTSVVFKNKIWIMGGMNGDKGSPNIWSSTDGITWTQAINEAPWPGRAYAMATIFQNKIWLIGGGQVTNFYSDGNIKTPSGGVEAENDSDVWSSSDGINWVPVTLSTGFGASQFGQTFVYNSKIWLINGDSVWSSINGINWILATKNPGWSARSQHSVIVLPGNNFISQDTGVTDAVPPCVSPSVTIIPIYPGPSGMLVHAGESGQHGFSYAIKAGGTNCMIKIKNIRFDTKILSGSGIHYTSDLISLFNKSFSDGNIVPPGPSWIYSMPTMTSVGKIIPGRKIDVIISTDSNASGSTLFTPVGIDAVDSNGNPVTVINGLGDGSATKITIDTSPEKIPECVVNHTPCG